MKECWFEGEEECSVPAFLLDLVFGFVQKTAATLGLRLPLLAAFQIICGLGFNLEPQDNPRIEPRSSWGLGLPLFSGGREICKVFLLARRILHTAGFCIGLKN